MIHVVVREGENIERAVKKFKRKFDRTKAIRTVRSKKQFTKKSVVKRNQILRARYRAQFLADQEA